MDSHHRYRSLLHIPFHGTHIPHIPPSANPTSYLIPPLHYTPAVANNHLLIPPPQFTRDISETHPVHSQLPNPSSRPFPSSITYFPSPTTSGKPPRDHGTQKDKDTYTFNPVSPESVYNFNIVLELPPAPAALADEGRGAAAARRLFVSRVLSTTFSTGQHSMITDLNVKWG